MILISGIHGVGKSYFCEKVKERCGIETYTASTVIAKYKNCSFKSDKKVTNISDNQLILLEALKEKRKQGKEFLLDGHFCLLDFAGQIERIKLSTYINLNPKAIVLLTEQAEVIADRRRRRDEIEMDINDIDKFQGEEKAYGLEVADKLGIPIFISSGSKEIEMALNFIIKNI